MRMNPDMLEFAGTLEFQWLQARHSGDERATTLKRMARCAKDHAVGCTDGQEVEVMYLPDTDRLPACHICHLQALSRLFLTNLVCPN